MKTLITNVTLQISGVSNSFTVFTDYQGNVKYDGFSVHEDLEEAEKEAVKQVNFWNVHFMSVVKGYNVIKFDAEGSKTTSFVNVK